MNPSVRDFERRLKRAGKAARAAGMKTLERYAKQVEAGMRAAAPVDDGELRASIKSRTEEAQSMVVIQAGGPTTQVPVRKGSTYTVDNAKLQEFGTVEQAANPFFFPVLRLYRRPMQRAVKRAMAKAARDNF